MKPYSIFRYLSFTGLCLVVVPSLALGGASEPPSPEEVKLNDAKWQCMEFLRKGLEYPDKADFEYFGNYPATLLPDGNYRIEVTYTEDDSEPQKKARCIVAKTPAGEWNVRLDVSR